jgi:hypothetical protein
MIGIIHCDDVRGQRAKANEAKIFEDAVIKAPDMPAFSPKLKMLTLGALCHLYKR